MSTLSHFTAGWCDPKTNDLTRFDCGITPQHQESVPPKLEAHCWEIWYPVPCHIAPLFVW